MTSCLCEYKALVNAYNVKLSKNHIYCSWTVTLIFMKVLY